MKIDEINLIIAHYMGYKKIKKGGEAYYSEYKHGHYKIFEYHTSLDGLIPVWLKMGITYFDLELSFDEGEYLTCIIKHKENNDFPPNHEFDAVAGGDTIPLSAARATALAIMKMEDDNEQKED